MVNEVGILRTQQQKLTDRVKNTELQVKQLDPAVSMMAAKCESISKDLKAVTDRLEDAESRSRRNNVRIIGMPEKIERRRAVY